MKRQTARLMALSVFVIAALAANVALAKPLGTPRVNDVEVAEFTLGQIANPVPTETVCTGTDGNSYVTLGGPGAVWATIYPSQAGQNAPLNDQSAAGLPVSLNGDYLQIAGTFVFGLSDLSNPGPSVGVFQGTMTITDSNGSVVAKGSITLPVTVATWANANPYVPQDALLRGTVNLPMKASSGTSLIANVELDLHGPAGVMRGSFGQTESPTFTPVPDISVEWNGQTC